jgi:hypothetical protein
MPRTLSKVRAPTRAISRTYISPKKLTGNRRKYTVKMVTDKGKFAGQCTSDQLDMAVKCARKKVRI